MKLISKDEIYKDKAILALIIDGEVVETFISDERFAAILQSNPTVIEISKNYVIDGPHRGWQYDGKDFHPPSTNSNY